MKAWKHFRTITQHKILVMKGCFRVGLWKQGLLHDLSKYSPAEFLTGVKFYQGTRSPNTRERETLGYSGAWLHHKGRNKHHYEYWIDYAKNGHGLVPLPMPKKYIVEMFVDRIAACKVYNKEAYTDSDPLNYYLRGKEHAPIHDDTKLVLESLLILLSEEGEKKAFSHIKHTVLRNKANNLESCNVMNQQQDSMNDLGEAGVS